jgi:hypothetical protein
MTNVWTAREMLSAVRERLGYEQLEKVIEELIVRLDE